MSNPNLPLSQKNGLGDAFVDLYGNIIDDKGNFNQNYFTNFLKYAQPNVYNYLSKATPQQRQQFMQRNVRGYQPAGTPSNDPTNLLGNQEVVAKQENKPATQTGNNPLSGGAGRDAAFKAARNRGDRVFEFGGERFTTQLAGESEENWNKHLQSKQNPVVPASNNQSVSTTRPKIEQAPPTNRTSVSTTQSNPVITDQNTDAQANQARYAWAKYMIDNPWAQPSAQDLADMKLSLLDYQKRMNTDSANNRRRIQHQLNMQKSRERQRANNAAARLAKQKLRQQQRNEIREVNQDARNERRDIRNRTRFGDNYNSPLDNE